MFGNDLAHQREAVACSPLAPMPTITSPTRLASRPGGRVRSTTPTQKPATSRPSVPASPGAPPSRRPSGRNRPAGSRPRSPSTRLGNMRRIEPLDRDVVEQEHRPRAEQATSSTHMATRSCPDRLVSAQLGGQRRLGAHAVGRRGRGPDRGGRGAATVAAETRQAPISTSGPKVASTRWRMRATACVAGRRRRRRPAGSARGSSNERRCRPPRLILEDELVVLDVVRDRHRYAPSKQAKQNRSRGRSSAPSTPPIDR